MHGIWSEGFVMFSILCRAASGRPHESTSVSCHEQDTAQNALLMNDDISMIVRFLCFSRFHHHRDHLGRTWGENRRLWDGVTSRSCRKRTRRCLFECFSHGVSGRVMKAGHVCRSLSYRMHIETLAVPV
ncbi:hypothetical protein BO94DRAFT_124038 [Aspergillus sclerotioniger CBS 115572]|uniref:Secreted protein n=1 Tax=Aspergillus sclerotioniger CBS 115572 TaxID=1450535 RepID=A0A317WGH6_9EURO|nr:hypothetical protein BO94DRAFT_124038 [Aspergillus sclerotioniger CBS 115572]PWY83290.1 hypothetical protein BO94DRAFT_124038 [Aspergillus sclerotioniger CBS 115572]